MIGSKILTVSMSLSPDIIDRNLSMLESGASLTDREKEVFALLVKACGQVDGPKVVVRAAGGWVRDKLIGRPSDDLDIAVENTSGLDFAHKVQGIVQLAPSKLVVIEANPEQSKHLETARICIFSDYWIDICGLRCDEYASESRIPVIRQGSPSEDAHRRDFTINSVFYNVNEKKVEDFCGGIKDLKEGLLRTPIQAVLSFSDDPLRILRAFRFASRFDFKLQNDIIPASKWVKNDFEKKITHERTESELTKALGGRDPLSVVRWIVQADMFDSVFDPMKTWGLDAQVSLSRVEKVCQALPENNRLPIVLAAVFQPLFGRQNVKDPEKKNKWIAPIECAIVRFMKFPLDVSNVASTLLKGASMIESCVNPTRVTAGRFVRQIGSLWPLSKFLIFDDNLSKFFVDMLEPFISKEHLERAYEIKPLMNGLEVARLHGVRPGKGLNELIEKLLDWQLENPAGTAEQYERFVHPN